MKQITDVEFLHAIIACLVVRLGGHVVLKQEEFNSVYQQLIKVEKTAQNTLELKMMEDMNARPI